MAATGSVSSDRTDYATRRRTIGAGSAAVFVVLAAAYTYHFLYWNFDDTFIIFRIVRNLLSGHGWAFNVGEAHNASTSVLNTLVIAVAAPVFSANIPLTAHVLAGIWLSIAAVSFGWIFCQRFDAWVALALGVGLIVTLADNILWGLEAHLFIALLGIFVVLEQRKQRPWVLLALLTLTRPDALVLAGLRWLRQPNLRGLLLFVLVLTPWVIFSLLTFQQVFPDTLANKMWQGRSGFWGSGAVYLTALASHIRDATPWQNVGYTLALPGLAFLIRDRHALLYVAVFACVQQIAYSLLNVPGYHWYFTNLDIAVVLAAFYGVGSMFQMIEPSVRSRGRYLSVALYVAVLTFTATRAWPLFGPRYREGAREVSYRRAAETMITNRIQPGPIAAVEVGALGYYLPDHQIVDLVGLASANPEYLTGTNSDRFFAALPSTVLLHVPVIPMERAIFDDIRFAVLYERGVAVTGEMPMQYFEQRPTDTVTAYVEQHYAPFRREADGPLGDAQVSDDAICFLDRATTVRQRGRSMVVSLVGWAYDRAEMGTPADVFAILTSGQERYSVRATRVPRPDVAAAYNQPQLTISGYTAEGSVLGVRPGTYRIAILQKRGTQFISCDVPSSISIAY